MKETKIPGDPPERLLCAFLCHYSTRSRAAATFWHGLGDSLGTEPTEPQTTWQCKAASLPPLSCVEDLSIACHLVMWRHTCLGVAHL